MPSRPELRASFVADLLPIVDRRAAELGFAAIDGPTRPGQWSWVREQGDGIRAVVDIVEMSGRQLRNGLDLRAWGGIVIDEVEELCRTRADRSVSARTLIAPLRSFGVTYSADTAYPLRWSGDPRQRMTELAGDLATFAAFADSIAAIDDLRPERLARSRIRRHVPAGLAPRYAVPVVAAAIAELLERRPTR